MACLIEFFGKNTMSWQRWNKKPTWNEALRVLAKAKRDGYENKFRITEVDNDKIKNLRDTHF